MLKTTRLTKEELLKYIENIDEESKQYCLNDCITCWDSKDLWLYKPIALINENDELLSVIFWSFDYIDNPGLFVEDSSIAYIQRLFTPLKHRNKGYFTFLILELYRELFDAEIRYVKLFIKKNVNIYKELNFVSLFDTKDGEYEFCMQPILFNELKRNNEIVAKNGLTGFFSPTILEYIEYIKLKYT